MNNQDLLFWLARKELNKKINELELQIATLNLRGDFEFIKEQVATVKTNVNSRKTLIDIIDNDRSKVLSISTSIIGCNDLSVYIEYQINGQLNNHNFIISGN